MGTTTVRIRELSEAELLKITYASDLFDDDIEICKKQYKAYSRKYHPDAGYDRNCFIPPPQQRRHATFPDHSLQKQSPGSALFRR